MNIYDSILSFHGTWRTYQARVLEASHSYLEDKKIHIVAAPGAGKTTLGIELIRRGGHPCLILSPRIVIRQQWLERIQTAFLKEGLIPEDYLSNNIQNPKLITSITYQTLFCGMTQYKGIEEEEDTQEQKEVDFSAFNLVETVKKAGIQIICLDECHHLKSQWWKALETFMSEMGDVQVIALTATPPYDSTPAQWERYCSMCGPVDEEISVPELVKEGSLCPHQDYVYFNYPSKEEEEMVKTFRKNGEEMMAQLMEDPSLAAAVSGHPALLDFDGWYEYMLEKPPYLSALLIYCQEKGIAFSPKWLKLLQIKKLPEMNEKWMEFFLQGFLFEDAKQYACDNVYREQLIKRLKAHGLLERNHVGFLVNSKVEKALINSKGKLQSICTIAHSEYESMGEHLRMLILTDYIRKEQKSHIGNPQKPVDSIGVLPIFELLRRESCSWKLGVLCGSMILLPDTALPAMEKAAADLDLCSSIKTKPLLDAQGIPLGYSEVQIQGKIHGYARLVTRIFEEGEIEILIGTKSLLGEGWDSPCINSLILASFVGSYVLSNQMRGRAIRTMAANPQKTSNIWHLVCLSGKGEQKEKRLAGIPNPELSQDFYVLQRRMEGFFGVSYDGTSIENGMERLNVICEPYTPGHIRDINKEMLKKSREREALFQQWQEAVFLYETMETTEECSMNKEFLKTGSFFFYAMGYLVFLILIEILNIATHVRFNSGDFFNDLFFYLLSCLTGVATLYLGMELMKRRSPFKRLQNLGKAVLHALEQKGEITSACRVEVAEDNGIFYAVSLTGGTAREKHAFADCLEEMLAPVDNQRYLLCGKKGRLCMKEYYCVPTLYSSRKEDAQLFQKAAASQIGAYRLIYTRNAEGRKILLHARAKAFANRNERIFNRKKKVKGALE